MLTDRFGRKITYLRVSVTDRCNFRCVYCMPPEGVPWQAHENILRYEEIERVVRAVAENGVREVRLTGGEPLARKHLADLVTMISAIPGIEDISLTTNGLLLASQAQALAEAGLKRLNISLDTLNAEKFNRITRGGSFERVWEGITAAEACGMGPIKLNVVAMKGVNDDELISMARLTETHPWHVRFIEIMPVKNQASWGDSFPPPSETYISIQEMQSILAPLHLQPVKKTSGSGPAREFQLPGAPGIVGFISPFGEEFCEECNRLRLTADGHLRPCLLADMEVDLMPALRGDEPLLPLIQQALELKPLSHAAQNELQPINRCMMQIGG